MKIGDVVTIKKDAILSYLDYEASMLGNTYTITDIDRGKFIQVNYNGGWWINVLAVEEYNSKTAIEYKIAVMYKRFANRSKS
jgi:hypothetical protein